MRVLIADDEYLARSSLRSMLAELELPFEWVGEAANGEEMVEQVRRHRPEVVFVDIHMPRLNGLEAIRRGRTISPHTRWLILTGFPKFDYAQEAIRLGVSEYLLKPVDPQELRRVLVGFGQEHRRSLAARNRQFEQDMVALFHGLSSLAREGDDSVIVRSLFVGAVLCADSHLAESVKAGRQLDFFRTLRRIADQTADNRMWIALFPLPSGELATVAAWEAADAGEAWPRAQRYLRAVEQAAGQASDGDLAITVLATQECPSFSALQDRLAELQRLAPLRALCGIGRMLELGGLQELAARPGWLELGRLVTRACRCYGERAYLDYARALQNWARRLGDLPLDDEVEARNALAGYVRCTTGCRVPPEQDVRGWMPLLEEHGERMLAGSPRDRSQSMDPIEQVISFVDQHYMQDIGIGQIAEQLHITPNYLSTLFHRKTGTTFMKYLTRARMLKAKELLADPNVQIQQVAEQVGYASGRYFAKLFTEFVGCYPSEYRDRLKARGAEGASPAARP